MGVPFNKPVWLGEHPDILKECLDARHFSGDGPYGKRCEALLTKTTGKPVRLTSSATHALEMMGLLADIRPGDEVILPSFTFVSTANAFALRGASLRFADNDDFGNLLPSEVERLLNKKTKAVMTMHYAGGSADLDKLIELCASHKIPLLEDAAQAIGAFYKNRPLGTLGALGCYSFHDTKNVTCGEGGALVFGDPSFVEPAEIIREKGTNRSQFLQGLTDKYTWVGLGSSYIVSDLSAAYLWPQLERVEQINAKRRELWKNYAKDLGPALEKAGVRMLGTPAHNTPNHHMFAVLFSKNEDRGDFISFMKAKGVVCPFHYVALHTSPFGATFADGKPERLPGCDHFSQCLVRLPLYYNMTDAEQAYVVAACLEWLKKH